MALEELTHARILLVDDDEDNLVLLDTALRRAGALHTATVSDPFSAAAVYREFRPDVVLLDLRMPPLDGFVLMQKFREIEGDVRYVPIIMLTGEAAPCVKEQALEAGVADFLRKDFDMAELLLRVRNVVRTQQLYRQVQRQKSWLEETVRVRTRQLQAARREVLERLALAAEFRDDQTGEHTRRVGRLCSVIAEGLGEDNNFVDAIGAAALLHDLGKIGIPDTILLKDGPLGEDERDVMREHTTIGAAILNDCTEPVMRMARQIALTHHEWWNGGGYPRGLRETEIPLEGRIVAVADAFDAMTNDRPYRRAISVEAALAELDCCSGTQFDPHVVQSFRRVQPHLEVFTSAAVKAM
jgi:putative two-component system response regulator